MKSQSILLSCLFLSGMLYAAQEEQGACAVNTKTPGNAEEVAAVEENGTCSLPTAKSEDDGLGRRVSSETIKTPLDSSEPGSFKDVPLPSTGATGLKRTGKNGVVEAKEASKPKSE